jgi:hypothetical protein
MGERWDTLKDPRMVAFIGVAVMGSLMALAAAVGLGFVLGGGGGAAAKAAVPPPPAPPADAGPSESTKKE